MIKFANRFSPQLTDKILLLTALGFAAGYLYVALARLAYPYALDFVEGGMLMQAWQVAQERPVFLPPNADFVPQVYMPLYTWLGGLLLRVTGAAFWPLRLISLLGTLTTASLLAFSAGRIQPNRLISFSCAALFLAGYRLTGGWYELARVDSLFVALVLGGMTVAVFGHLTNRGLAVAGLLMALAILTKQNGLLAAVVVGIYLMRVRPRKVWLYALVCLAVSAVPVLYLEWSTAGWFSYYVIDIAYASPVDLGRVWPTVRREIMGSMGFLLLLTGAAVALHLRRPGHRPVTPSPWLLFMGTGLFISLAGRSSVGGNLNNLILGFALLCLSPALLAAELPQTPGHRSTRQWLLVAAIVAQFVLLRFPPVPYGPGQFLPTGAMRLQGDALRAHLMSVEGDVLVMLHSEYALLAGKEPAVNVQSLWHARRRGQAPLPADLVARISGHYYAVIISDESLYFETEPALLDLLEQYYQAAALDQRLSPPTLSGMTVRPRLIYTPKAAVSAPQSRPRGVYD